METVFETIREEFNGAARAAHESAVRHGFYCDVDDIEVYFAERQQAHLMGAAHRDFILAQLAKVGSEVGEAVQVCQTEVEYAGLGEELADIIIRTMDLAEFCGIEIGDAVAAKMEKNLSRARLHGKIC